jgi:hypothetical protein
MTQAVSSAENGAIGTPETGQEEGCASSPFVPYEYGWQPVRLAELASNGFPFSPTFLLPQPQNKPVPSIAALPAALPFGFHYCRPTSVLNRPVIDLTRGQYDPHTQTYTIALCAGGDTDGGTIDTGHYTEICGGDGVGPAKEWDTSPDRVTD